MGRNPQIACPWTLMACLCATLAAGAWACGGDGASAPPVDDVTDAGDDVEGDADTGEDAGPDAGDAGDDRGVDAGADAVDEVQPDIPIEDGDAGGPDLPPGVSLAVVAVSPERGPVVGGTEILLIGVGFAFDTDVFLGGKLCENIDVVDDTKIICDTPPNAAGVYDVKVTNDLGIASLPGAFTYFAPVALDTVDPSRGPTQGGMPVTLTGTGFTDGTQVSIGGRVAPGIEFLDDTTLRLLTPSGPVGPARVQVSNENGLSAIEDGFEYYQPVRITRVVPGAGLAAGGEEAVIQGVGFTEDDDLTVEFGLLEADFEVLSSTEVAVTTPPGPTNAFVDVTVTSELNGAFTQTRGFYYHAETADLSLFNVVPTKGSSAGGDTVLLSGANMGGVDSVEFGGSGVSLGTVTDRWVEVTTATHAPGAVDVEVFDGGESALMAGAFTFIQAVTIDGIAPATGDVAGGTPVTITGGGFVSGMIVRVGGLVAGEVDVSGGTQLTAVTPPGVVGPADVVLESPDGLVATLAGGFTYTAELRVHGLSPTKGAVAGGTYVVVRGAGFVEPITVSFGTVEATNVTVLDSATLAVRTPAHDPGFADVGVAVGEGEPVQSPDRFLYFDPTLSTGGQWGDEILGSVNVTVFSTSGAPLPNAFVQLSVRAEAEFFGYTDANGQVTLSGPDLSGAQTVTATRVGFSTSTVDAVNAENITVFLSCIPENQCGSTADCRDGFVCTCGPPFSGGLPGICLVDPFCGFEAQSQEEFDEACSPDFGSLPVGQITGNLTGVHKVDDPGPNERIMAIVSTTRPHPFSESRVSPGSGNVLNDDGPYTLRSRVGELAVVAVCGIYNEVTNQFTPRFMGVRRGLNILDGETYEVDLNCNIEMDQTITIKSPNSPLSPDGPDRYIHTPYLHFGGEGYFGGSNPEDFSFQAGPMNLIGTSDVLSSDVFAPLEGPLAGLDYYIIGAAYTGSSIPLSIAVVENVHNVNGIITLPELVPPAEMTTPRDGGLLIERYIEWELETDNRPDFYSLLLVDYQALLAGSVIIYWDVLVPGTQTSVNLPYFGEDAEVGIFPAGQILAQIQAVDAINFDYNNFDNFNNFVLSNWRSWSISAFIFSNPG